MFGRWWRWHEGARAAWCIGVAALGVMSVVTFRALATADENARTLKAFQLQSCERGNVFRAFTVVDVGRAAGHPGSRQRDALRVLPLVDCRSGRPLPVGERDARLDAMAARMGLAGWRAR